MTNEPRIARIALLLAAAAAAPACIERNPEPEVSPERRTALVDSAKLELDRARAELVRLRPQIDDVQTEQQRDSLRAQARVVDSLIEDATKRIMRYEAAADTEGIAGTMLSELADINDQLERLRIALLIESHQEPAGAEG